jgi:hypothetical protein
MTIYFHVIFWSDLCCRSKEYFFPMSRLKKIRYSDEYDLTFIVFSTGLFSNATIRTKGNVIKIISKAMLDSENLTIELCRNNIRIYK